MTDKTSTDGIRFIQPGDKVTITVTVHHQTGEQHELARCVQYLKADGVDINMALVNGAELPVLEFLSHSARAIASESATREELPTGSMATVMGIH